MKYTPITLAVVASLLAGCATSPADNAVIKAKVESSKAEVQQLLAARVTPVETSPVSYSDQSWIPLRKIEKSDRDVANAKADKVQIEINQRFGGLNDAAGTISSLTGLPVFIGSDVRTPTASGAVSAAVPVPMGNSLPGGPP